MYLKKRWNSSQLVVTSYLYETGGQLFNITLLTIQYISYFALTEQYNNLNVTTSLENITPNIKVTSVIKC